MSTACAELQVVGQQQERPVTGPPRGWGTSTGPPPQRRDARPYSTGKGVRQGPTPTTSGAERARVVEERAVGEDRQRALGDRRGAPHRGLRHQLEQARRVARGFTL